MKVYLVVVLLSVSVGLGVFSQLPTEPFQPTLQRRRHGRRHRLRLHQRQVRAKEGLRLRAPRPVRGGMSDVTVTQLRRLHSFAVYRGSLRTGMTFSHGEHRSCFHIHSTQYAFVIT